MAHFTSPLGSSEHSTTDQSASSPGNFAAVMLASFFCWGTPGFEAGTAILENAAKSLRISPAFPPSRAPRMAGISPHRAPALSLSRLREQAGISWAARDTSPTKLLVLQTHLGKALHPAMHCPRRQERAVEHAPVTPTFLAERPMGHNDGGVAVMQRAMDLLGMSSCRFRMWIGQFRIKHGPPRTRSVVCVYLATAPRTRQGLPTQSRPPRGGEHRHFCARSCKL